MNRILFLPRNRHLFYYAKRALLRGHWPRFGKVNLNDGWTMPCFSNNKLMAEVYWPTLDRAIDKWQGYFKKRRTDFLVVDRETNIEINGARIAARKANIPVCYVMHGSDIFHYLERKRLVWDYDYLYVPNLMNVEYFKAFNGRTKIRRFNKQISKCNIFPLPTMRVMYVPMYNHPSDMVERSGCLLSNRERYEYNQAIWEVFTKSPNYEFLWCHNPKLDREQNEMVDVLSFGAKNIKWVRGRPSKYFKDVDAVITDVGSTAFFEAMGAGKKVLCLYHAKSSELKSGVWYLFKGCLTCFTTGYDLVEVLKGILSQDRFTRPYRFDQQEMKPNDPLVWEE